MELKEMSCVLIDKSVQSLSIDEIDNHLQKLAKGWNVIEDKILTKSFPFENFNREMLFANDVAAIAVKEDYYPEIWIRAKTVIIKLKSFDVNGLTINDFIMAAKIDEI